MDASNPGFGYPLSHEEMVWTIRFFFVLFFVVFVDFSKWSTIPNVSNFEKKIIKIQLKSNVDF